MISLYHCLSMKYIPDNLSNKCDKVQLDYEVITGTLSVECTGNKPLVKNARRTER